MRMRTLYTGLCLVLLLSGVAHAARNEEVVIYPSLLMFGEVGQSVSASYSYSRHSQTGSAATSASSTTERYSLSTIAAILDPHLATIQIFGSVNYTKEFDQGLSILDGEYTLGASLFDLSYHPVAIGSSRTTTLVSNGFTPSYTVTSNVNQISATLLSDIVPVQIFFVHVTSGTSGLTQDSSTVSDSFGINLHHDYYDISTTDLAFITNSTTTDGSGSSSYNLGLNNSTNLDKERHYRLSSSFSIDDSKSEDNPQRNIALSESLQCVFGKALTGTVIDRYIYQTNLGFDQAQQAIKSNNFSATLSHRLFQSLTTTLAVGASNTDIQGGTSSSYSGSASLGYTKQLPGTNSLTLAVGGGRAVSSQDFPVSKFLIQDEVHLRVNPGDRIIPGLGGKLVSVILVHNVNGDHPITYQEFVDYRTDLRGGFIEILPGGTVVPGSDIAISYSVLEDPSLSFQSDTVTVSGKLSMLTGKYVLSGSYQATSEKQLSGLPTTQILGNSTSLELHADANRDPLLYGAGYGFSKNSQEDTTHYDLYANYRRPLTITSDIVMSARDTYSTMRTNGTGDATTKQNNASISAGYNTRFFDWVRFTLAGGLNDSRGSSTSSDFLTLRGSIGGAYNQIDLSLSGQFLYRVLGSIQAMDNSLTFSIKRYF
jgi:hypothetical protein